MATEEEIRAEVEELGRMSTEQEVILYNLVLRQDELGRQQTNMLLSEIQESELYQGLIKRELLTYEVFNHGTGKNPIASLYVTLKGTRYCIMYADEIEPKRAWDAAGRLREHAAV